MTPTTAAEKLGFLLVLAIVGFSVWVATEAAEKEYGLGAEGAVFYSIGAVVVAMGLCWLIIARLHSALAERISRQKGEGVDQPIARSQDPPSYSPSSGAGA